MNRKRRGRIGGVALAGAAVMAELNACAAPMTLTPPPLVEGVIAVSKFQREAVGGGVVTVDAGVIPGALPETNMSGPPTTVAWFSNEGEGGKREKRYGWKPNSQAEYELVLSNDGSGRTKWTMNEINRASRGRVPVRTGHLWVCDDRYHATVGLREIGFKECTPGIPYDPTEDASNSGSGLPVRFASYRAPAETSDGEILTVSRPVWISCNSGCCTLGR